MSKKQDFLKDFTQYYFTKKESKKERDIIRSRIIKYLDKQFLTERGIKILEQYSKKACEYISVSLKRANKVNVSGKTPIEIALKRFNINKIDLSTNKGKRQFDVFLKMSGEYMKKTEATNETMPVMIKIGKTIARHQEIKLQELRKKYRSQCHF